MDCGPIGRRYRAAVRAELAAYAAPRALVLTAALPRTALGKVRRHAGKLPFIDQLLAAYFCAIDPTTPGRVRGILLAALAYFILPFDIIPTLFIALGLVGDAAVIAGAIRMVSRHIKPRHYQRAREMLGIPEPADE